MNRFVNVTQPKVLEDKNSVSKLTPTANSIDPPQDQKPKLDLCGLTVCHRLKIKRASSGPEITLICARKYSENKSRNSLAFLASRSVVAQNILGRNTRQATIEPLERLNSPLNSFVTQDAFAVESDANLTRSRSRTRT